ncbi:MAG: NAD(P)-dependent oxidoreductase [Bryobacterales bacterium]|nr:NAD(P)-dependent oxidoreductase [Bryobacterales bacterium]
METIGFIGVGLLGTALATRFARAGFSIHGFDPAPSSSDRLAALGGSSAPSPEAVVQRCRRIFFSLPGPGEVRETIATLLPSLPPGGTILDTTTGDPADVERHAALLHANGIHYLDCEIGGSSKQAAAGEAIVICGGSEDAFAAARDLLDVLSPKVFHTGAAGTGTRMKLALNIAIGLHRAVMAESLAFAEKNGIEAGRALEILKAGPAYSRAMDVKGMKMLSRDYTPEARVAQHLKDVRLILETGGGVGARLPLSELHRQLLEEAVERGFASLDNSSVIELFRNPDTT